MFWTLEPEELGSIGTMEHCHLRARWTEGQRYIPSGLGVLLMDHISTRGKPAQVSLLCNSSPTHKGGEIPEARLRHLNPNLSSSFQGFTEPTGPDFPVPRAVGMLRERKASEARPSNCCLRDSYLCPRQISVTCSKGCQLVAFPALPVGLSSLWQGEVKSFFSSRYSVGEMVAALLVNSQLMRKVCQQP